MFRRASAYYSPRPLFPRFLFFLVLLPCVLAAPKRVRAGSGQLSPLGASLNTGRRRHSHESGSTRHGGEGPRSGTG